MRLVISMEPIATSEGASFTPFSSSSTSHHYFTARDWLKGIEALGLMDLGGGKEEPVK